MRHPLRPRTKGTSVLSWLASLLTVGVSLYCVLLFGWFFTRLAFGDHWWWLFLINTFAVYLFMPLPVAILAAILLRRSDVSIAVAVACVLCLWLYGGLFLPRTSRVQAANNKLTVMSYNLLVYNKSPAQAVAALRSSGADIVAMQELSVGVADAIKRDLADLYPYQLLDAHANDAGMGVISRYPIRLTGERLTGGWIGTPQVIALEYDQTTITLVNLHNVSFPFDESNWRSVIEWSSRERERQAQQIVEFAKTHPGPLIVCGDFNTAELSVAHTILTSKLRDSWREAGFGFGHTFPGGTNPQNSRFRIAGIAAPEWLVRIDYVFHSDELQALEARIGPWDGNSDHRPVMAELFLVK